MKEYLIRRLISLIFVLIGMSLLTFILSHVVPADPARAMAGPDASGAVVEEIRHRMGLDRPLPEQYLTYMGNLLKGDLGESIEGYEPVSEGIERTFPASLELAIVAMLVAVPVGLIFGVVSALHQGGMIDFIVRALATLGVAIPVFVVALVMVIILYARLGWIPVPGRISPNINPPTAITGMYLVDSLLTGNKEAFLSALWHIIGPGLTLAIASVGGITRITRSSMLEVLQADYIRTARAKGLRERLVLSRHALRNAMVPIVTTIGYQLGALIAWVFMVELVFAWPGIGSYTVRAITLLDFNVVMGVTLIFSIIYVLINFVVDLIYLLLDPRITF
jgi:peptide/nickel transport system permease protein